MKILFDEASVSCSTLITKKYSTSFSLAIKLLTPKMQKAIYAIYGFVRLADEIVDSFQDYPQSDLLQKFEADYYAALNHKISLNPILNCFQEIVHKYKLEKLVVPFLTSMKMDLDKKQYHSVEEYNEYIYGSADVVGLMCLKVFVNGNEEAYNKLKHSAMKLGSAFQKVNFLRDAKYDYENLGRIYFPGVSFHHLTEQNKKAIILEIKQDFAEALEGIKKLPVESKFGVYTAYKYYWSLLKKIENTNAQQIFLERIRVSNPVKIFILLKSYFRYQLNMF